MASPTSCPDPVRLQSLLEGDLTEAAQTELTSHVENCPHCQDTLERLAASEESWCGVAQHLGPEPPAMDVALQKALEQVNLRVAPDTTTPPAEPQVSLDFLSPSQDPAHLGRLAHYEVTEIIGRGGMGIVLKAFDAKLHRVVAIKVMAPQWAANATARKRFIREAQACAAVRDEHVIDIHAVEEAPSPGEGLPYLVMEYICGKSLQERLDENGPLELKEILRIGHQAASGLAAAHAQGLIHRDIKPANILLENSVERVKITDFGLARAVDDASISHSGMVAGTPQYMSPEQARGEPVDHRSDLFSLGSVLYAICTGRAPFRAHNTVAVLRRVSDDTPRPIPEINPDIPAWLLAIIDKLHAKEPADRYQSAAEVAELLSQHLAQLQQPSVVPLPTTPPVSPPSQGGEKTRVPLLASKQWHTRRWAAAAAILLVVLAGLGFTEATGVTKVTEFVATVLEIRTPEGTLIVEVDDPNVKVTIEGDGGLVITGAGPQEVRLKPGSYRVEATKDGKPVKQELVTITRGGKQVVTVSLAGRAEPPAAKAVGEIRRFDTEWEFSGVAVSPDGRHFLASFFKSPGLVLCDSDTGNTVRFFTHPTGVSDVVYSADGRRALSPCYDGHVRLWDVQTGKELRRFEGHTSVVRRVALSRDGRYALSGGEDKTMRLWDVETGKELHRFEHPGWVTGLAISPDGRYALSGNAGDSLARLWDVKSGKELQRFDGHFNTIYGVAFSADSRRALTGSADRTVRLWDVESGEELRQLHGHTDTAMRVAFSPNGRYALSGGGDKSVRLWDLDSGKEVHRFDGHTHSVMGLAFFPDGRRAVSVSLDKTIRVWQLPDLPKHKPEKQAFVVLGGKGVPERKFDTLAEAVLNASDGDTIEIRGNGPFVSEPIKIGQQALRIRAGEGFRPVIKANLNMESLQGLPALITSNARLVLEGLEFELFTQLPGKGQLGIQPSLVRAEGAPLLVANCRFRMESTMVMGACIYLTNCPLFVVTNSEFLSSTCIMTSSIGGVPNGARWDIQNCLQAGGTGVAVGYMRAGQGDVSVRLTHNTLQGTRTPTYLSLWTKPEFPEAHAASKPIRLEASQNIFRANSVLEFDQKPPFRAKEEALRPAEAETLLLRLLDWRGQQNVYAVGAEYLKWSASFAPLETYGPMSLTDWKRFWGSAETDSLEGRVHYQGGDLISKLTIAPEKISPEDFRLRPDSAGYRAGKDGRDLGADVNLVGPGAAYERWKKTPEYQEWLKETGQKK